jgi:bla regulator protein blaR1
MEFQWLNFLPSDWVNALYGTLFHSLWIGVVMALVAGIIIICTQNSTPSLRYNLLAALLGIFSLTTIFVFYQSLDKINQFSDHLNRDVSNTNQILKFNLFKDIDSMLIVLGTYANQLILVWFGVIMIKFVRLMAGLKGIHHLKRTKIFDAGTYWQNKVNELSRQLYIKQSVQILQSGMAKIPMVIGHFKPIILMPLGMLNHLSLTEVEAILSHELAHIKRRDYLVNIIQNILEVLFFFNPAVLWISKMIKEERENCCDDLAIYCTNDKNAYLKALVSCQEFNLGVADLGMAITGHKNQLLFRIRRIAFNNKASLSGFEKMALTISLVLTLVVGVAFNVKRYSKEETFGFKNAQLKKQLFIAKHDRHVAVAKVKRNATTTAKEISHEEAIEKNDHLVVAEKKELGNDKPKALSSLQVMSGLPQLHSMAPMKTSLLPMSNKREAPAVCVKPNVSNVINTDGLVTVAVDLNNGGIKSTTISTTVSTVKIDGKVVSHVVYHDRDSRADIQKDMINDSLIVIGENPKYILNYNEMLVNGVKQHHKTHQKYKDKYIKNTDTQYRIGS